MDSRRLRELYAGVLLGTAVGDALGLPAENLSPEQIRWRWKGQWRMHFVFGRGMFSDDTEHTLMVSQALLAHPDSPVAFQRALAWKTSVVVSCIPGGSGIRNSKGVCQTMDWIPGAPKWRYIGGERSCDEIGDHRRVLRG